MDLNLNKKEINRMIFLDSIIASTISNSAGLIIGHPLDTIKVCLQLNSKNKCKYIIIPFF